MSEVIFRMEENQKLTQIICKFRYKIEMKKEKQMFYRIEKKVIVYTNVAYFGLKIIITHNFIDKLIMNRDIVLEL